MNTTHTKTAFGYSDARSKAVVWNAYADHFGGEEIMEEGFNVNTGYVYIALENGITLASCFGQSVDFLIYDSETDDEIIFGSYEELANHLNK